MSVENHRHCQATVLGATGDPYEAGSTWSVITTLSDQLTNLPPNWVTAFENNNNITDDLAEILRLINGVAGDAKGNRTYELQFFTNNATQISHGTIDPETPLGEPIQFRGFGRDVTIRIGNERVKFNTMQSMPDDKLEVDIPEPHLTQNMFDKLYPVGSIYLTLNGDQPFQTLADDGIHSTWVKVSKGECLWGATDENDPPAGTELDAGLPNITGTIPSVDDVNGSIGHYNNETGAFYRKFGNTAGGESVNNKRDNDVYGFDASRSNPIYGKSNTVQPPAFVVNIWKRTA